MDPLELTEDELDWAHEIRKAIFQSAEVDPISDFECAQWALASLGWHQTTIPQVLEHVWMLQCFLQQYKLCVPPSSEEGMSLIRSFCEQQPGSVLAVDYLAHSGNYLLVYDAAAFSPERLNLESDWKITSGGFYYFFLAMSPNLRSIREGVSIIIECEGVGLHNVDSNMEERWLLEFGRVYPFRLKELFWINPPTVINMLYGFIKRFVPRNFQEVTQLGKIPGYEGGRMDQLFNMPTPEIAQQNLLQRIETSLRERLENQRQYTLPTIQFPDDTATDMHVDGLA